MPTDNLQQLKKARSALKTERIPVSHVQDALKETKEITQFVKAALSEDNRWILQAGESESIVSMLNDITRTNKLLYNKCRTPHHFEQNATQFMAMRNKISHHARCIHLSLDQGFYDTEPLGFSPGRAVELSLEEIKKIRAGVDQGKWSRLPINSTVSDDAKEKVISLIQEAEPLGTKLLTKQNLKSFEPPLSIAEIQWVYQYFQKVHRVLDLEGEGLNAALKEQKSTEPLAPEEILRELSNFEGKLQSVKIPQSNKFPGWGIKLYEVSKTDLFLRMDLLRIPFEPLGFLNKQLNHLKEQKESVGLEQAIADLHNNATQESEHLQLFIETFQGVDNAFEEVSTILKNLSISFGKIYHNASAKTLTNVFLGKALGLVKGLLEKAERVAISKSQKLFTVQESLQKLNIFDTAIDDGLVHVLELIDQGTDDMKHYHQQLEQYQQTLSSAKDWESRDVYALLQKSYDERTMLTSASMVFGSVTKTCALMEKTLGTIAEKWEELQKLNQQGLEPQALYDQSLAFLGESPEFSEEYLIQATENLESLNWALEEMLINGPLEEVRYVDELKNELHAAQLRIQARKLKAEAAKTTAPASEPGKQAPQSKKALIPPTLGKSKKSSSMLSSSTKVKKDNYDPFDPGKMESLKRALKEMESEQAKMLHHVLTHNHMFFTLLNQLERVYITDTTSEYQLEQNLEKSKTTIDFLTRFGKLKLLTKGYYSSNDVPFEYDEEGKRFKIPAGVDRFLKLNKSTINQPIEVYTRLIRVLLGLDDSKTVSTIMPRQCLSILQEDLRLSSEEQKLAEDAFRMG